ncbi:MAG: Fe-Mn family superoxide dismutase [Burkholderiales bacterium]
MRYELKQIYCRPWLLNGLSLKLMESHYENNYGGALRRLNAITQQLEALDFSKAPPNVVNGLKREELVALNSTLLHELYFASLGGEGKPTRPMAEALTADFGSADRWREEFMAMARALAGGSGWVVLVYVPRDRRLINQYASDHSQSIASGVPILAIDMYEHAYHIDFGANAKAYIDAFMRNVDWNAVEGRYEDAKRVAPPRPLVQPEFGDLPGVGVEEVKAMLDSGQPVQVIDARPRHYLSRQGDIMVGATWRDPDRVQEWAGELSKSEPVVTFCAYGFHVGCKTAIALRDAGFDAKYMTSGHSGWKAIGGPTTTHTSS